MALLEWLTRRGKGNNSSPERGRMIRGRERLVQPSLRRDKVRRIVERVRQPAEHLARHDLPELSAPALPIVEDRVRPFAVGGDRVFGNQRLGAINSGRSVPRKCWPACRTRSMRPNRPWPRNSRSSLRKRRAHNGDHCTEGLGYA